MQDNYAHPDELSQWRPTVSGNAALQLSAAAGRVRALQLDFDFKGGGGFVVARRALSRPMPADYAIRFRLRGAGPVNNLELKLVDATGQNVWRHVFKDLHLPARWHRLTVDSGQIDFAWGPSSGSRIAQLGFIEFAVVAGQGGKGTIWIADFQIEDRTPTQAPAVDASSELPGFEAAKALEGSGWKPRLDDRRPWISIDSRQPRPIGGVVIDWLDEAPATGFRLRVSTSGRRWRTVYSASRAGGKRSYLYLPGLTTRFVRLEYGEPATGAHLGLESADFSRSIDAFWHSLADNEARGWHPRWLHREQSLWTPIGTANGTQCALMNDDGMIEVGQGSFSIEPMLLVDGRLGTWADVTPRQELKDGWMPVPAVMWESADWRLLIEAQALVNQELRVRYRVLNLTERPLSVRLFVLLRPFQVTPPWQHFRNVGGVSRIGALRWSEGAVRVDDTTSVVPASEASGFGAVSFDEGCIAAYLSAGTLPHATTAEDAFGFASGALEFALSLPAQGFAERVVNCRGRDAVQSDDAPAFDWQAAFATDLWAGNGWMSAAVQAALTATAHILVTRSGPALQPGPRRYTRSWIRDGAMMSAALLRMRRGDAVLEFIRWYAPNQRDDGFVPCCVDNEGIDWLVEHDSHGQLIALIADYHRFSSDEAFLDESWSFVEKAVGCIERLLGPDGLLPISVSHEGYLAQPVHSYWDDFWALKGLRDAVGLARAHGRAEQAQRWAALGERFSASLFASIEATRAERHLDFIPGSIEWADFDPTATANALYLLDVPKELNRAALEQTFDRYLADWRSKRSGAVAWTNYTPYEIRIIGALVRLGRRDAALELLQFFLADRRPPSWNQWPEIAWRDTKAPAHLGDLPHTWIAAEYVLAVRTLIGYEREADRSLVLAAGLASEWIDGSGVRVHGMPTLYGSLSYSLRRLDARTVQFEIGEGVAAKVVLRPPLTTAIRSVTVNGAAHADFDGDAVTIGTLPANVICISA